jgi:hypothetical protein
MPTIELDCQQQAEHGTHVWRPDARPAGECFLPRYLCNGWWPRPRDNEDWPITLRPRWVRKDQFWHAYEGGCRYCGQPTGHTGISHQPAQCKLCGTVQCHRGDHCLLCFKGFLPGYRPGEMGICGYSGCSRPAVASIPGKVRRVCLGCVPRVPVRNRDINLAGLVGEFLRIRDSGKPPQRWRLVA